MTKTPDYLKPYAHALDKFGGTFEATLWRSQKGQEKRFRIFIEEIDFTNQTIVDVGCGIGDFASFLIQQKTSFTSLIGVDALEKMITTATKRNLPNCTFTTADVFHDQTTFDADWILFSGTLNTLDEDEAIKLVHAAYEKCSKGVAFNFLSDQSGRNPESEDLLPAKRFNTLKMLSIGFDLTPKLMFTQTYLDGHDATIILRK